MDTLQFIDLTAASGFTLLLIGFVGGLVSGFIGSGGAFVLTPAMMSLGVPGIVAVASNMAHKFPKALVASIKRAKLGQVDLKLGLIMGAFAEVGVYVGKEVMTYIRSMYGDIGTDFYVSIIFVITLAIIGGMILLDARRSSDTSNTEEETTNKQKLAKRIQSIHIPGTMVYLRSIDAKVSVIIIAPLGFATGLLAAFIAVGGFIGVPAMMFVLGVPAIMATATELVVAFVMGLGGSMLYAWEGYVDIRLSMLILAGSLFGVQVGVIATTYVKENFVKKVMASIMLIVLVSRLLVIPDYLSNLELISPIPGNWSSILHQLSDITLALALFVGAIATISASIFGALGILRKQKLEEDQI
jgi:uncharacterized membrane protein YfcA